MKNTSIGLSAVAVVLMAGTTQATIVQFDLLGRAGGGLLTTNETGVVNGSSATGGEVGAGIFFDDVTNVLTLNVAWGSANGFADLSGNATAGHLHGPTAGSGVTAMNQTASVKYGLDNLPGWTNLASSGGFVGTVNILVSDVEALYAGRFYMNVHTAVNGGGEFRGNLVVVPAPGAAAALGLIGIAGLRRRR